MKLLTPVPHIATRVHLDLLPTQDVKENAVTTMTRQFFGVSLCAAPYFANNGDALPISSDSMALNPYLPWEWQWIDEDTPKPPGFRWVLLAQMQSKALPKTVKWQVVPFNLVKIYAKPPAGTFDDSVKDPTSHSNKTGTIHDDWWRNELIRLTVNQGRWNMGDQRPPKPLAHASQLDRFYLQGSNNVIVVPDETEEEKNPEDKHLDILGARVMRWATEIPPYNYYNRLSAILTTPVLAELRAGLLAAYGDSDFPTKDALTLAAVPLWCADASAPGFTLPTSPLDNTLIVEQDSVPSDGKNPATTAYLRRTYVQCESLPAPAGSTGSITVEVEPWRKDLEKRVARCVDLPLLLLDWAATIPTQPPPSASVSAFINSTSFVEWIVDLSADLFGARKGILNPPATHGAWLQIVSDAADKAAIDTNTRTAIHNAINAVQKLTNPVPVAQSVSALRAFLQPLRDPKTFSRLRELIEVNPEKDESNRSPNTDWVNDALVRMLKYPLPSLGGPISMRKNILPSLKDDVTPFSIKKLVECLKDFLLSTRALQPPLPPIQNANNIINDFATFLSSAAVPGKANFFRNTIYGDRSRPIAKPHGFYLVAGEERILDPSTDPNNGGYTMEDHDLGKSGGILLLGRFSATGQINAAPWLSLNAGCVRVQIPDGTNPPAIWEATPVIQSPLRPAYLNGRWSESAVYDNRPLAAVSIKQQLVQNPQSRLQSPNAKRYSPTLEVFWPKSGGGAPKLPPLRYYGHGNHYQFCCIDLYNCCALPQGFWLKHPAILDLSDVPSLTIPSTIDGVAVTTPVAYLRRVGISPVHLEPSEALDANGKPMPSFKGSWPLLPAGVFPIAAELPAAATQQDPGQPPDTSNPQTPHLVVLFPTAKDTNDPKLKAPETVLNQIKVNISKPRTSDENWERWVSADQSDSVRKARLKVCAEAHNERDTFVAMDPNKINDAHWQPDDPALSAQFLIIFRPLYPANPGTIQTFVRTWDTSSDAAAYGDAVSWFTSPFELTLIPGGTVNAGPYVTADPRDKKKFKLATGVVVELEVYALLAPAEQARFDDNLVTGNNGTTPVGFTVATLLDGGPAPAGDPLPDSPDKLLAVSPAFLRIETANLAMPDSQAVYENLVVSGKGAKVSLAVNGKRGASFDLIHEVEVQEQIWRWNGKPCMPEDFPEAANNNVTLPTPLSPITDKHFPWDGIAFHNREDSEHLAVMSRLPLISANSSKGMDDVIYTEDKSSDARALYFRFSALMRSRYYGVWPRAIQAGETPDDSRGPSKEIDPLWKRYTMPHRLTTKLKKPSVVMVIPLLASGNSKPQSGDSAGVLAIIREAAFEQGGLAEKLECEVVRSDSFKKDASTGGLVKLDGKRFFQAGYDPIFSTAPLKWYPTADSQGHPLGDPKGPLEMSGPSGLTFDQVSRDPLIVNSLYYIDVDRKELAKWVDPQSLKNPADNSPVPASYLYCQIRFRRTLRWGYDADGRTRQNDQPHPLASDWTDSQWVKFLADSDLLRPNDGSGGWDVTRDESVNKITARIKNWAPPAPWSNFKSGTYLSGRNAYLLCVTRDTRDAVGRPMACFHSLYQIDAGNQLSPLALAPNEQDLAHSPTLRLRGRIIEVLCSSATTPLPPMSEDPKTPPWYQYFMPPPRAGVTRDAGSIAEDATFQAQALSAAFPIAYSHA